MKTHQIAANYAASLWAGRPVEAIKAEIARISAMWEAGPGYQFPGSAAYQFCRMEALKTLLLSS